MIFKLIAVILQDEMLIAVVHHVLFERNQIQDLFLLISVVFYQVT